MPLQVTDVPSDDVVASGERAEVRDHPGPAPEQSRLDEEVSPRGELDLLGRVREYLVVSVAEVLIVVTSAWSSSGVAAWDSPEKAGPTTPMIC